MAQNIESCTENIGIFHCSKIHTEQNDSSYDSDLCLERVRLELSRTPTFLRSALVFFSPSGKG